MRKSLILLIAVFSITSLVFVQVLRQSVPSEEQYANFSQTELAQIRWIIYKACTIHTDRQTIVNYIRNESFFTFESNWNVFGYKTWDLQQENFYTTAFYNKQSNKRFYRSIGMCQSSDVIYLVETNNTQPNNELNNQNIVQHKFPQTGNLKYPTKVSRDVTAQQLQQISAAVEEVYERTKDLKQYSVALQQLIVDRHNQLWSICSTNWMPQFAIAYTSPYNQWIEFIMPQKGSIEINVYVWRNYRQG